MTHADTGRGREARALTRDDAHPDAPFEQRALEVGIRLIDQLVANGTLTDADAAEIYARALASISDPDQRAATLRTLEAMGALRRPQ